jgi:hypothetical protein
MPGNSSLRFSIWRIGSPVLPVYLDESMLVDDWEHELVEEQPASRSCMLLEYPSLSTMIGCLSFLESRYFSPHSMSTGGRLRGRKLGSFPGSMQLMISQKRSFSSYDRKSPYQLHRIALNTPQLDGIQLFRNTCLDTLLHVLFSIIGYSYS